MSVLFLKNTLYTIHTVRDILQLIILLVLKLFCDSVSFALLLSVTLPTKDPEGLLGVQYILLHGNLALNP